MLALQGPWWVNAGLSALVTILVIAAILRSQLVSRMLDQPNARSLHVRPVPRIGGLGMLAGLLVTTLAFGTDLPWAVWLALALVVGVSLLDDVRSVSAAVRLPIHLAAGVLMAWMALPSSAAVWILPLAVALAWMINLYNFMDGSDGLAGAQAFFGFGAMTWAALGSQEPGLASTAAALAGAALGFLMFNWPPARIFMGDAGSTSLGLLAGGLGVWGVRQGVWSPLFPVLAFLPFIADASLTLADRILRRQRVWQAHREHAYQRLNLSGWGHRHTALAYGFWMFACAATALIGHVQPTGPDFGVSFSYAFVLMASAVLWGIVRFSSWLHRSNRG